MAKKVFTALREVLTGGNQGLTQAAEPASREAQPADLRPLELFDEVCGRVGDLMVKEGFSLQSGPMLMRRNRYHRFIVAFLGNHEGEPGEPANIYLGLNVSSPKIEEWRKLQKRPMRRDDFVVGTEAQALCRPEIKTQWEIAAWNERSEVSEAIATFIEEVIVPYCRHFDDPNRLLDRFGKISIPAFSLGNQIEYALAFGRRAAAQAAINQFLRDRPDLEAEVAETRQEFHQHGLPSGRVSSGPAAAAWAAVAYRLHTP